MKRNNLTEMDLLSVASAVETMIHDKLYERTKISERKILQMASYVASGIVHQLEQAALESGVTMEEEKKK